MLLEYMYLVIFKKNRFQKPHKINYNNCIFILPNFLSHGKQYKFGA